MADTTYKYLSDNGLLFLLQQLKTEIDEAINAAKTAVATGSANGTISVDGTDVAVKGLDTAAYKAYTSTVTSGGMDLPTAAAVYNFVTTAISQVSGFHAEIVSALPSTGESNILYLVAKSTAGASDAYDEYLYINGAWECVGSTSMDLSGYVKTADMHEITNAEITAIVNEVWS